MQAPNIPENFLEQFQRFLEKFSGNLQHSSATSLGLGTHSRDEWDAYTMMAPQYAYGRHRGPAPKYSYRAAVAIALLANEPGHWSIPLTLRPPQMVDHAGQVSLPGGRAERNETAWETANREFCEELGCSSIKLQAIGTLPPLYVFASRHCVTPVVAFGDATSDFQPNPEEVAELLWLPLQQLLSPDVIQVALMQRGTSQYQAPGIWVGEHFVWGATAMILIELRSLALQTLHSA